MKKRWQTFLSIALYIIILTCTLDFNILKLVDLQLMFLVLLGTLILTLPFLEKGIKWQEVVYIFGRRSIEAGFIQTFLLLFSRLQNTKGYEELLGDIALCFRPLLYGFCLLILLTERTELKQPVSEKQPAAVPDTPAAGENTLTLREFTQAFGLTKRETEIAQLITQGKSNAEIAGELFISETTVKKHVSNIFEKTGINRREELIVRIRKE